MATTLNLVSGATTVNLNSGGNYVIEYVPGVPSMSKADIEKLVAGAPTIFDEPMVDDTVKLVITGASVAAIEATAESIEKLLTVDAPRRWHKQTGNRIFLKYQPNGGSALYRADIEYGKLEVAEKGFLDWQLRDKAVVYLMSVRRRIWEADTEVQIPLTNANDTDDTDGLPVFNCNDGTGAAPATLNNYAQMAAANIDGVLPVRPRIEITHTFGTQEARRFYIAHKAQGTPASFMHTLEAEDATLGTDVTSAVCATCSGGDTADVANIPAAERTLFTWTLTETQVGYIVNQWIKVIGRFSTLPSNATIKARLKLQDSVTTAVLAVTEYVTLSNADYLQVLGTLLFSPLLQGQTTPGAIKLVLTAKDAATTGDFSLDFIQLSPVEIGSGFRFLKPIDEALVGVPVTTGVISDDLSDGNVYMNNRQGVYRGFGGPILLFPNTINRLYFLHDAANATAAISRSTTLKVYHRPRILTI